jgi:intein-encoded DNA endonuclease-like protein
LKQIDIRYIAGFFDAEGCIVMGKTMKFNPRQQKRYLCTTIRMETVNTDFGIIKDIHKYFKIGHLINIKPRKKGYKKQLRWQLTHRQAEKVIKKLLPHMREKNKIKKARDVLKYYE